MEMVGVATSSGVKSAPRSQAMVFLSVSPAFHIQMCEYPRMEGNIVLFLGTSRRSESERQQKVLSILLFVGDAKIIGNLFYDKIFSLHLQNLWETQK